MAQGKRTPLEVLKDQGTYRPDRHSERVNIEEVLEDAPVIWLNPDEAELWPKWYGVLQRHDILKETDDIIFGLLCRVFKRTQELNNDVKSEGTIIDHESDSGAIVKKRNPRYDILHQEEMKLLKILSELGMTPSARGKVKASIKEGADPFEAAMNSA